MAFFRSLYRQAGVYLVLSASFAHAALQNVTVDDAVLVGAVVPQYEPSPSDWNIGNNCTTCLAKPDPSLTYNGTWHDATYESSNGYTQAIEFTFTGSGLYIFFIMANNVTGATTFTDISFVLDQVTVGTYTHTPSTSTDYEYNVPVYANGELTLGQHDMRIQPVDTGNHVLMLFDYLIYTMDTSSSVAPSASATLGSISSPSSTSAAQGTSNTGAIVGGVVGGVGALALVGAFLLCYRKYQRRKNGLPPEEAETVMDPYVLPREIPPTPPIASTLSGYSWSPMGPSAAEFQPTSKTDTSALALQPSILPASTAALSSTTAPSSSGAPSSHDTALIEQVELLRDEVARLRHLRESDRSTPELQPEAPPRYSLGQSIVI